MEIRNQELLSVIGKLQEKEFTYTNLVKNSKNFFYLTGLTVEQFDLIIACVQPYVQLIAYPHSKGSGQRSVDTKTELVVVLAICRHSPHCGVMAIVLDKSRITVQRNFTAWIIFLATVFNQVDLRPSDKFLLHKMPKIFKETGHGKTDLIIDATEFKFQSASNFELNSLMFSNYKNTVKGKALIGITPHGMGMLFSEIYPGSISDSEITEKAGALNFVEEEHEIMSDRGFSIQELCAIKGVALNRPKQKDCDQFSQKDVALNFDIAATRIHVEGGVYWQGEKLDNFKQSLAFEPDRPTFINIADALSCCLLDHGSNWTKRVHNEKVDFTVQKYSVIKSFFFCHFVDTVKTYI